MQSPSHTTASTLSREESAYRQSEVDDHVKRIMELIMENPYITTPTVFQELLRRGPCWSRKCIVHLFGGSGAFNRVYNRMETLRWAVATDSLHMVPIELFNEHDIEYEEGKRKLSDKHWNYLHHWSPEIWQLQSYDPANDLPKVPGVLYRYPVKETWEYLGEINSSSSEDDAMSDDMEVDD